MLFYFFIKENRREVVPESFLCIRLNVEENKLAKKKVRSPKTKKVRLKSVTLTEQNPAAVDVEAFKRTFAKTTRTKSKRAGK
jgi:hypothetical protein